MTQNNNTSMATVVETFIVEETQELIYDNEKLSEWNALVSNLELKGQTAIAKPEKSPIPFLHMKQQLVNAFSVLCPVKEDIKDYNKSPIPVEILQLAALSTKEQYFDFIQIWYDDKSPDPVCVGLKKGSRWDNKYVSWSMNDATDKYLIGRWGDVKMSLDAIIEKAKSLFKQSRQSHYEQEIRECKRRLEDLETEVNNHLGFALPGTGLPF